MAEKCSCGKWYDDSEGVELCQANRHGNGKTAYTDKTTFEHVIEIPVTCCCAECDEPLTFKMAKSLGGDIEYEVMPHRCQIDEPE